MESEGSNSWGFFCQGERASQNVGHSTTDHYRYLARGQMTSFGRAQRSRGGGWLSGRQQAQMQQIFHSNDDCPLGHCAPGTDFMPHWTNKGSEIGGNGMSQNWGKWRSFGPKHLSPSLSLRSPATWLHRLKSVAKISKTRWQWTNRPRRLDLSLLAHILSVHPRTLSFLLISPAPFLSSYNSFPFSYPSRLLHKSSSWVWENFFQNGNHCWNKMATAF